LNSDFAAGYGLAALRARWRLDVSGLFPGRLEVLGRIDNLANRAVAGTVIVSEANGRFFEPAPARSGLLSLRWTVPF
jgi:iron complex outermembrane recepter protein